MPGVTLGGSHGNIWRPSSTTPWPEITAAYCASVRSIAQVISQIETGWTAHPSPDKIAAPAAALGVTTDYLDQSVERRGKAGVKIGPRNRITIYAMRKFLANIRDAETLADAKRAAKKLDEMLRAFDAGK